MAKKLSAAQKLVLDVQKSMGNSVRFTSVSELRTPFHIRRPFGLTNMDILLDNGSPGGSIVQFHGPPGAGKNLLTYLSMAENQRVYGADSCMFMLSFGYAPDISQMRLCGMKIAFTDQELEGMGIDPFTATVAERGVTVGELHILELGLTAEAEEAPAEKLLAGVMALMASGLFQIGAIDELGSGETKDNIEKGFEDNLKIATWSSLMTRVVQRIYTILRRPLDNGEPNAITLYMLNPARANIAGAAAARGKYKVADLQTSGHAVAHGKALDIHIRIGKKTRKGSVVVAKEINWEVKKGKNGIREGIQGSFVWDFTTGVDLVEDLVQAGLEHGTIYKEKKLWRCLGVEKPMTTLKGDCLEYVRTFIEDDPLLFLSLKNATIEAALYEDEE